MNVDAGFTAAYVTTGTVFPPPSRYPDQQAVVNVSNRILEAVRAIPGVEAAGITSNIALSGVSRPATIFPADRALPAEELVLPLVVSATPGYFEALSTPLVRGRRFADTDRRDAPPVAIVDERLAARLWPNEDPIGKQLHRGGSERNYTVVGVVSEVRFEGLAAPSESIGAVYFPEAQAPPLGRLRWLAIKTAGQQAGTVGAVRDALYEIDPDLPLADVQTMAQRTSLSVASERLAARLASTFGLVAMFLSMLGIYGVLAYTVAQRRREIGIRMVLGNTARGVFRLVFKEGCTLIAAGLAAGLAGAVALGRVLEAQLFGVEATDPVILGTVVVAAGCVTLLACVGPALRAARVDPVEELQR